MHAMSSMCPPQGHAMDKRSCYPTTFVILCFRQQGIVDTLFHSLSSMYCVVLYCFVISFIKK